MAPPSLHRRPSQALSPVHSVLEIFLSLLASLGPGLLYHSPHPRIFIFLLGCHFQRAAVVLCQAWRKPLQYPLPFRLCSLNSTLPDGAQPPPPGSPYIHSSLDLALQPSPAPLGCAGCRLCRGCPCHLYCPVSARMSPICCTSFICVSFCEGLSILSSHRESSTQSHDCPHTDGPAPRTPGSWRAQSLSQNRTTVAFIAGIIENYPV